MKIRILDASEYDGLEFEIPGHNTVFYLPEPQVLGERLKELLLKPEAMTKELPQNRRYLRYPRDLLTRRQAEETEEVHIFIHDQMADNLRKLK